MTRARPGVAFSATSRASSKELEARRAFQEELKAGPLFDAALALDDARDDTAAVEGYRKVYKKHGSIPIGELAKKRAEKTVADGLPGLDPDCEDCYDAKRACAKHKEDVKL